MLAVINREPGRDTVLAIIDDSILSAVNLAEVATKLIERGIGSDAARGIIETFHLGVSPFTEADSFAVGELRPRTRAQGLSLGDRACLALAGRLGLPAYTADRAWAKLEVGVRVVTIR